MYWSHTSVTTFHWPYTSAGISDRYVCTSALLCLQRSRTSVLRCNLRRTCTSALLWRRTGSSKNQARCKKHNNKKRYQLPLLYPLQQHIASCPPTGACRPPVASCVEWLQRTTAPHSQQLIIPQSTVAGCF